MNTQSYQQIDTTETEIDLVALLKRVCVQWRAILIFSIIIGLLASGIKYAKDMNAYNASLSTQKISGKEAVETSGLKQEEIDAVQQAVSQKRQITAILVLVLGRGLLKLPPAFYPVLYQGRQRLRCR